MIEILLLILIGVIAACLTMFLNYCIGNPGSEKFSPYEIFSSYTVWLAKMRLKRVGMYDQYSQQYHENLKRHQSKPETIIFKNDFKKVVYDAAEPFFTWERAVGMCPVCFGFWVSLGSAVLFSKNIVDLLIIIVISHVTIRIFNKIL